MTEQGPSGFAGGGRRLLGRAARAAALVGACVLAVVGCGSSGGASRSTTAEETTTVPEAPPAYVASAGGNHSCAIRPDGVLVCWGENTRGQLGDGTTTDHVVAAPVAGIAEQVVQVSAGPSRHTCALTDSGRVLCWGKNERGSVGDGSNVDRLEPTEVTGLPAMARSVGAGGWFSCALLESAAVSCWGGNSGGQLGDGTLGDSAVPVPVVGLPADVTDLSVGGGHSCVLTSTGGIVCWGLNGNGQIGNGGTGDAQHPADVAGLPDVATMVSAGGFHTCAVTGAGGVVCWGSNQYGQLGDGSGNDSTKPVPVAGLDSGVVAVSAGLFHTCALRTDGSVVCWGKNDTGGLGDGTTADRRSPVATMGLPASPIVQLAVGGGQTCAAAADGTLWCWGENLFGQVGNGTTTNQTTAMKVG